jgi:predicted nucleic acid-binding protein
VSGDSIYLLDASALMTLLEDEDGAGRVEEILLRGFVLVPFVALLEVYYITLQERGETVAMQRHELIKRLPATLLWQMDEPVLLAAARFKASQRISLADAIVAGFASVYGAVLVHKDPEFEVLAGTTVMEALPYK